MKKKKKNPISSEFEPSNEPSEALSYEELSMLKATLRQSGEDRSKLPPHDQSDRAHFFRFFKKNRLVAACSILIAVAILAGSVFGVIRLFHYWDEQPCTDDFTILIGNEKTPYEVAYDEAVRNGVFYVDMKLVADLAGMIASGSHQVMQFSTASGQLLRFEHNSDIAKVNSDQVQMTVAPLDGGDPVSAVAILTDGKCLVPYGFLSEVVEEGLLFKLNREENILTIKRIYNVFDGDYENAIEAELLLSTGSFPIIPPLTPPPKYEYSYLIDISPYLDSIVTENLLLANKQTPLPADFAPNVIDLQCETDGEQQRLQEPAAKALYAMMLEMKEAGITDVFVTSSYRSYANQKWLYHTHYYDQERAAHPTWSDDQIFALISTYSARPGESEHQTGLCLDFTTNSIQGRVDSSFEGTDAFAWLSANAYKFGFILRYPKDKVDVTQYSYEAWHYRFVGRAAATEIHMNGLCLEEYLNLSAEAE